MDLYMKGLTIITILGVGYAAGLYKGCKICNDGLNNLARTGKTVSNFVDGKEYICSVTEKL